MLGALGWVTLLSLKCSTLMTAPPAPRLVLVAAPTNQAVRLLALAFLKDCARCVALWYKDSVRPCGIPMPVRCLFA